MTRAARPYRHDANDPTETLGSPICCDAQRGISYHAVVGCNLGVEAAHETAGVHHPARRCGAGIAASGDWAVSGEAIHDRSPLAGNLATGAAADGVVSTGAASAGLRRGQER